MAETFDIAIVGAGITGCAIARQLARYDLSICVVEAANDIALGASKANGGLVHAGYDPVPGTVKAQVLPTELRTRDAACAAPQRLSGFRPSASTVQL